MEALDPILLQLVSDYRSGDADAAVDTMVSGWRAGTRSWSLLRGGPPGHGVLVRAADRLSQWQLLEAGIMLHTEAALWLWREEYRQAALDHLGVAHSWLATVPGPFSRTWLLATIAFHQSQMLEANIARAIDAAADRLGEDAEVIVARGMLAEVTASTLARGAGTVRDTRQSAGTNAALDPRFASDVRRELTQQTRDDRDVLTARRLTRWRAFMSVATRTYRRALEVAPDHREAQLRLGRALVLSGSAAQGLPLLERARAGQASARIEYLSSLFIARAHEDAQRLDDATREYRRALDASPSAQSAAVGLAHVLFRQGRRLDARAVTRDALDAAARRADDPWWNYDLGYATSLAEWLRQLRETARQ